MSREYAKVEILSKEVFHRKAAGEANRVKRQNQKARLIAFANMLVRNFKYKEVSFC